MVVHLTSSHEFYYENGFCSVFSDILYKNIIACMETMLCNYKCTSTLSFFLVYQKRNLTVSIRRQCGANLCAWDKLRGYVTHLPYTFCVEVRLVLLLF